MSSEIDFSGLAAAFLKLGEAFAEAGRALASLLAKRLDHMARAILEREAKTHALGRVSAMIELPNARGKKRAFLLRYLRRTGGVPRLPGPVPRSCG